VIARGDFQFPMMKANGRSRWDGSLVLGGEANGAHDMPFRRGEVPNFHTFRMPTGHYTSCASPSGIGRFLPWTTRRIGHMGLETNGYAVFEYLACVELRRWGDT